MFGYYIEVPRAAADLVPSSWKHIQTHPKALRYRCASLQKLETSVNDAASAALELEHRILRRVRLFVLSHLNDLRSTARSIAQLDVLASWAHISDLRCDYPYLDNNIYLFFHPRGYTRPVVSDGMLIDIRGGRHPVVELYQVRRGTEGGHALRLMWRLRVIVYLLCVIFCVSFFVCRFLCGVYS